MDPFYVVRDDVSKALRIAGELFSKWQSGRDSSARDKLEAELKNIDQDLGDLEATIAQVEANRTRFKLDDAELNSRRSFVTSSYATLSSMKKQLSGAAGSSLGAGSLESPTGDHKCERDSLLGGEKRGGRRQKEVDAHNQELIDQQALQQQEHLEEQDQALDGLHGAVGRLKQMSGAMNEELIAQNRMLSELEEGIDVTASSLDELKKRVKKLLPEKERGKKMIIVFLTIVLVILCVLVFSD